MCLVAQSCRTLCDPMDCSLPGSSVHGDSPGKNTEVGCHSLLQGIFPTQESNPGLQYCKQILHHLSWQSSLMEIKEPTSGEKTQGRTSCPAQGTEPVLGCLRYKDVQEASHHPGCLEASGKTLQASFLSGILRQVPLSPEELVSNEMRQQKPVQRNAKYI